jgi:hypothetical protein
MRKLATILSLLFSLTALANRITLLPGGDGGNFYQCNNPGGGGYLAVSPGDTLVVSKTFTAYLAIESLHGTALLPVVIISDPTGQVVLKNGFDFKNFHFVKMTGSTTPGFSYGFRVTNPDAAALDNNSVALSIQGRSSDYTIEWVQVYRKTYGAWLKQDPFCPESGGADSLNYPTYHMNNITLQWCDFKNIYQDCIYAGNTDPTGNRNYGCTGPIDFFVPMRLSNVKLLHLTIDSCNRSGIQLSGCDSVSAGKLNEIAYCTVTRCGYEYNFQQGGGILLGGMTAWTSVHDNVVKLTYLPNYTSFGVGTNFIYRNSADSAGYLPIDTAYHKSIEPTWNMDTLVNRIQRSFGGTLLTYSGNILKDSYVQPQAIFIDTRPTTGPTGSVNNQGIVEDSTSIIIQYNTIGQSINDEIYSRSIGIYAYQTYRTYNYRGSLICSNWKKDGTPTGVSYRGAADGQDPNPPSTYEFHFSTDCNGRRSTQSAGKLPGGSYGPIRRRFF